MDNKQFEWAMYLVAAIFTLVFSWLVVPALLRDGDVIGAFASGFVNPYASGYSMDVILCWVALLILVVHDRRQSGIRGGVWYLLLGIVPGVAVGLALYLASRQRQLAGSSAESRQT